MTAKVILFHDNEIVMDIVFGNNVSIIHDQHLVLISGESANKSESKFINELSYASWRDRNSLTFKQRGNYGHEFYKKIVLGYNMFCGLRMSVFLNDVDGTVDIKTIDGKLEKINKGVSDIACGDDFVILLKDGKVHYTDKENKFNFTEINDFDVEVKNICSSRISYYYSDNNNKLYVVENNKTTVFNTFIELGIKKMVAGSNNLFVITDNGQLWAYGGNKNCKLGLGSYDDVNEPTHVDYVKNVVDVYCGVSNTFIKLDDETIWGCGLNNYNQLDSPNNKIWLTFKEVNVLSKKTDAVFCSRYNDVVMAQLEDKSVIGCGYNGFAQLGLADYKDMDQYVECYLSNISHNKFLGIKTPGNYTNNMLVVNGKLGISGNNDDGLISLYDYRYIAPFAFSFQEPHINTSYGHVNTVCLLKDHFYALFCNGDIRYFQSCSDSNIILPNVIKMFGGEHIFAIDLYGKIYFKHAKSTQHGNTYAMLHQGLEFNKDKDAPMYFDKISLNIDGHKIKNIVCAYEEFYVMLYDGSVFSGNYNRLELNEIPLLKNATQIEYGTNFVYAVIDGCLFGKGDCKYLKVLNGESYVYSFTKIPDINNVKYITIGYEHMIIVCNDGTIYLHGQNDSKQLSLHPYLTNVSEFYYHKLVAPINIPEENLNITAVKFACLHSNTYVYSTDGKVYCCGTNEEGVAGIGYMPHEEQENIDDYPHLTVPETTLKEIDFLPEDGGMYVLDNKDRSDYEGSSDEEDNNEEEPEDNEEDNEEEDVNTRAREMLIG